MTKTTSKRTPKTSAADAPPTEPAKSREPKGKLGAVVALMRRPEGASLADMQAATGWQAHSVRGAIAGSIKKKLGLTVTSDEAEGGRVYRIVEGPAA